MIVLPPQTSHHKPEVTFEKWDENFFQFEPSPSSKSHTEPKTDTLITQSDITPQTSPCRWFVGKTLTREDVEELQELYKNVEFLKKFIKDV